MTDFLAFFFFNENGVYDNAVVVVVVDFVSFLQVALHWSYYRKEYTDYYIRGDPPSHTHFLYIAIVMMVTCESLRRSLSRVDIF